MPIQAATCANAMRIWIGPRGKEPYMNYSEESREQLILCDLCGQAIVFREIHITVRFIHLCADCLKHLESMPGDMQESIERILMGNVI